MEAKHIDLSQAIRGVLPLVGLMKESEYIIKHQEDTLTLLCGIF